MSYTKQTWETGDTITAEKLNHIEDGVDDASRQLSDKQNAPETAGNAGQVLGLDDQLHPVWVNQTGGGLSEATKQALLQIAQKVAYTDDLGEQYYNDLHDALYPPAELLSIDAIFNQGVSTIYDDDNLDSLRDYLVVTAYYDNAESDIISTYTLSGRLTAGTSIITASYEGKSDTFEVNVTEHTEVHTYSSANGLVTFEEDTEVPVKMICAFQPVQSGSGTPSAENVRAITGWNECKYGHNLVPMPSVDNGWVMGYLSNDQGNINSGSAVNVEMTTDYIPVTAGDVINISVMFSDITPSNLWHGRLFYDENKNPIRSRTSANNPAGTIDQWTEEVPTGASYMRFSIRTYNLVSKIFCVSGSVSRAIWNISSFNIPVIQSGFGNPSPSNIRPFSRGLTFTRDDESVLSIWAGNLEINQDGTSTLTELYTLQTINGGVIASTTESYYNDQTTYGYIELPVVIDTSNAPNYCDMLMYTNRSLWTAGSLVNYFGHHVNSQRICIRVSNSDFGVDVSDSIPDRVATVNDYLSQHPLNVLLRLATPVTYMLSAAETERVLNAFDVYSFGTQYSGELIIYKDGSADLKVIPGYIDSYNGESLSGNYISSQAAPNTTPITGSQVFDFGATPIQTYHLAVVDGIETIIGQNNMIHDMNGRITVEY